MTEFKGFRGGKKPPVPEGSSADFHDFIRWLEDHNYCKVIPCSRCYFWHDKQKDPAYSFPEATCRRHHIKTYHDDYCSDAVQLKDGGK